MTIRIAVLEDDPGIREMVVDLLHERGYVVQTYGTLGEAAELEQVAPQLLIADVNLPDGDGLDLVRRLFAKHGHKAFPVLVLSSLSQEGDILRGYSVGADEYMTKPFLPAELLAKVAVLLTRSPGSADLTDRIETDLPVVDGLAFGRYRLDGVLGQGAFGTVYRAWDVERARVVALKVLAGLQGRETDVRFRFLRESYALSIVESDAVVKVVDFGVLEGRLYFSMEYVEGPNLKEWVTAHGAMSYPQCLKVLRALARALEALRVKDLLHRDLKPLNVVLRNGAIEEAVLVDFGLAKREFDRGFTRTNLILGTPGYIAPELFNTGEASHRADLFSLGMVARYARLGAPPFPALSPHQLMIRIARSQRIFTSGRALARRRMPPSLKRT